MAKGIKKVTVTSVSEPQKVQIVHPHKKKSSLLRIHRDPFKNRLITTLRYSDYFNTIITTAGVFVDQVFNMNGIFDPDQTNIGHQPYGRDVYTQIYNRYRVWSLKYTVEAIASSAAVNQNSGFMIVLPNENLTPLTNGNAAHESPHAKSRAFGVGQSAKISGSVDLAKMTGVTKGEYGGSDRYATLSNGNPSELMGLHILMGSPFGNANVSYRVDLWYTLELFDPIQQGQS